MRRAFIALLVASACSSKTSSPPPPEDRASPVRPVAVAVPDAAPRAPETACVPPGEPGTFVRANGPNASLCWHGDRTENCVTQDASGTPVRTTTPSVIVPLEGPVTRVVDGKDETQDEGPGVKVRVCVNPSGTDCKYFLPPVTSQPVVDGATSADGTLVAVATATDTGDNGTLYLFDVKTGKLLDQKPLKGGDDVHPGGHWSYLFADHTVVETFAPAATDVAYVSLYPVKNGKLRAGGSSKHPALEWFQAGKRVFVWSKDGDDLGAEVFDVESGKPVFETSVKGLLAGADDADGPLWIGEMVVGDSVVVAPSPLAVGRLAYIPIKGPGPAKMVEFPACTR